MQTCCISQLHPARAFKPGQHTAILLLLLSILLLLADEVVQKHKHPNQINLLSNMKRSFAPLRTAGLQTPRPRTPPLHELPEHLPDRFSLTPTLAQPSTTSAQHNQLQPLQHFSSTCLEQEGGPVSVSTASGTPSSPPAGHATRNNSMHGVPHSSIIAPRAAFQAILESEDDDSVGSGGKNRDRDEAAHTLKPQHARTHSTEHIVNSTAPTHSGPGDTAPFRGQLLAPGSPTNSLSCTSSSTHACAVDHRRMHACKSDAQPTNDKAAACIADEHHPPEAALNAAATGNSSDNPAASIAVQWGLLSNACVGDSLGDRLLAEYQVGPCMTPSHMDAVRFTPELNGRAAFMVRQITSFCTCNRTIADGLFVCHSSCSEMVLKELFWCCFCHILSQRFRTETKRNIPPQQSRPIRNTAVHLCLSISFCISKLVLVCGMGVFANTNGRCDVLQCAG